MSAIEEPFFHIDKARRSSTCEVGRHGDSRTAAAVSAQSTEALFVEESCRKRRVASKNLLDSENLQKEMISAKDGTKTGS
jgi:hypothetical protein